MSTSAQSAPLHCTRGSATPPSPATPAPSSRAPPVWPEWP
uniref:Uncharacterized protein n=1 Tax=Rhizophora mucronata TaxID=61149 RepID=A0A2P2R4E6_RHIMU